MLRHALVLCGSLALPAVLVATGCTVKNAYPPVAGPSSEGFGTPADAPGPEVMGLALKAVAKRNGEAEFAYSLPAGLREKAWTGVDRTLGSSVRRATSEDARFYAVDWIRIDGGTAEVGVLAPRDGHYQLFTVRLSGGGLGPFRVAHVQPWTVRQEPPVAHGPFQRPPFVTAQAE